MSSYTALLNQLSKACGALRKLVGFGKGSLKEKISKAVAHLKEAEGKPEIFDFALVLEPYFTTANLDAKHYHPAILDGFLVVLTQSTFDVSPDEALTAKIIETVKTMYRSDLPDSSQLKFCKLISTTFTSAPGRMYVHGNLLKECFRFLLRMNSEAQSTYIAEVAQMTIQESLRQFIDRFNAKDLVSPDMKNPADLAKFYASFITKTGLLIQEVIPGSINATSLDVDLIIATTIFTDALIAHKLPLRTLSVCAESLSLLLESESPFIETPHFLKCLITNIHVALLSLALDNNSSLANATSRLILTIWRKFAANYVEGLNEVLDRGIATALTSPSSSVIERTLNIVKTLASEPQFWVDAFVNYDCDHSGFFRNIFENSIKSVVKYSYPGSGEEESSVQKVALETLLAILSNLWRYFLEKGADKQKEDVNDDAQNYLDAKKAKDIFDQGLELFKRNPKKGLAFFIEHKIVEQDPQLIADFLFNTPSLDPAAIGETIAGAGPLNLEILPKFVGHFDFHGLSFENAFRQFLSKFQIPGEAQMIDRVMEQFGSKFYNDNPDLFSCADTVYVLAFSTLMLHTDAHHPNVKQRMTFEEFVSNNKGIDSGKDLPTEFLESLYKGITSEKINLMASSVPNTALLTRKQQAELYRQQCTQALSSARERIATGSSGHQFHRAESSMLIGPMYHSIWGGVLAAFTTSFQDTEDRAIIDICLNGFQVCTHIASHCYVEDALQTMVDSFSKFTRLGMKGERLEEKNFLCTNSLILCAIQDRNFLKGAWGIILGEISALDRMKDDLGVQCDMRVSEGVFTQTSSLDRESILDFAQAMCDTSEHEVHEDPPRTFTLVKFSDVAYWNMDRPMYIWNEIWNIIGKKYLVNQGQSNQIIVASATIDVIRQLARKFLPKPEMTQFHFQMNFLEPFALIFQKQKLASIRSLILDCVESLASELAAVLHSGWSVFLAILTMSATDDDLKERGFAVTEKIITTTMDSVKPHLPHLMDVVKNFVISDHENILAQQAVTNFSLLADSIKAEENENWVDLFDNLTRCAQHEILQVEQCAEEMLISVVTGHGCMKHEFADEVWHKILSSVLIDLIPITTRDTARAEHGLQVFKSICQHLLFKFPDAVASFKDDVLSFLAKCCSSLSDMIRDQALENLRKFVEDNADDIRSPSLMKLLLAHLRTLAPRMVDSVFFVESIGSFIEIFASETDAVAELMEILVELSLQCQKAKTLKVQKCWCKSRYCYFRNLISQGRARDTAAHLKETICLYNGLPKQNKDWNRLIVDCLGDVRELDETGFDECCAAGLQLICQLIETEAPSVRKALIQVLRRRLGK